jgi:hypothetical protein
MTVSEQRKASMKQYNQSITLENKQQYAMTRIFVRLKSGQQKVIQKNTLTKFPWTEIEKEFLKDFIPSQDKKRQRIIEPEPQPEQEPEIDYETELHCDKVRDYLGSRHFYVKPNRVGAKDTIADETKRLDKSNVNVVCRVYETEDFRKILDDTPETFNRKMSEYIIPTGKRGAGGSYKSATLKKKMAIIFTLLNEYPPAINYVKQKHDFKDYYTKLGEFSGELKNQEQADTIQRIEENPTTMTEILHNVKELFNLEDTLKNLANKNKSDNLHHLLILLYTYGMFNKKVKPENISFISRLSLDDILLIDSEKPVFRGDGKFYAVKTGRMYLSGVDSSKTGFTYNYIVPDYVRDYIQTSYEKFPRKYLLDTYTSTTVGRVFQDMLKKADMINIKNNTDYRHLFETVYRVLKVDEIKLSKSIGHAPLTGRGIYKMVVSDENDDGKRKLIVEFFKTLSK